MSSPRSVQSSARLKELLLAPCRTPDQLHAWVQLFTGLNIPRVAVVAGNAAPFDYLIAAYFEPAEDLIVWAPRGGGKTRLAALATLLDLLHKPGCAVRILGGSLEQSLRMWEHLVPDLERLAGAMLRTRIVQARRVRLANGSTCAVLTQSQRAVRGLRVQKLRCDEVELFDEGVWEAAQLVTRTVGSRQSAVGSEKIPGNGTRQITVPARGAYSTADCRPPTADYYAGTIEALSTHHRPFGLMAKLLDLAQSHNNARDLATPLATTKAMRKSPRVIRWCLLDVLQRCGPERDCQTCALWDDCGGVAKARCAGFVPIDDAIALKSRVSAECWQSEMMCRRPSVSGCVFPAFEVGVHVSSQSSVVSSSLQAIRSSPVQPPSSNQPRTTDNGLLTALSIDFGFANPFVCLWIQFLGRGDAPRVFVVDEYVQAQQTIDAHLQQMQLKDYGTVAWVACDPAGNGRSDQTAASNVALLRRAGYRVRFRGSRIVDGVELIRRCLRPAAGAPRLLVHPRCQRLIKALRGYRYPDGGGELPLKDGEHDHLIDALRYFFVNNVDRDVKVSTY